MEGMMTRWEYRIEVLPLEMENRKLDETLRASTRVLNEFGEWISKYEKPFTMEGLLFVAPSGGLGARRARRGPGTRLVVGQKRRSAVSTTSASVLTRSLTVANPVIFFGKSR
jgi:hypothetical protein